MPRLQVPTKVQILTHFSRLRPYHRENTGSRPITKVLSGGASTWMVDHLGIPRVLGFALKKKEKKKSASQLETLLLVVKLEFSRPIWRLHTELYKFPRNVSANNSRTVY